jgi:hypothetical protein
MLSIFWLLLLGFYVFEPANPYIILLTTILPSLTEIVMFHDREFTVMKTPFIYATATGEFIFQSIKFTT